MEPSRINRGLTILQSEEMSLPEKDQQLRALFSEIFSDPSMKAIDRCKEIRAVWVQLAGEQMPADLRNLTLNGEIASNLENCTKTIELYKIVGVTKPDPLTVRVSTVFESTPTQPASSPVQLDAPKQPESSAKPDATTTAGAVDLTCAEIDGNSYAKRIKEIGASGAEIEDKITQCKAIIQEIKDGPEDNKKENLHAVTYTILVDPNFNSVNNAIRNVILPFASLENAEIQITTPEEDVPVATPTPPPAIEAKNIDSEIVRIAGSELTRTEKVNACFKIIQALLEDETLNLTTKRNTLNLIISKLQGNLLNFVIHGMVTLTINGFEQKPISLQSVTRLLEQPAQNGLSLKITAQIHLSKINQNILLGLERRDRGEMPQLTNPPPLRRDDRVNKNSYFSPWVKSIVLRSLLNAGIYGLVSLILSKGNPMSVLKAGGLTLVASMIHSILRVKISNRFPGSIYAPMAAAGLLTLLICKVTEAPISYLSTLALNAGVWAFYRRKRGTVFLSTLGVVVL